MSQSRTPRCESSDQQTLEETSVDSKKGKSRKSQRTKQNEDPIQPINSSETCMSEIKTQLDSMNKRLSKVMLKDDPSLKEIIKVAIDHLKNELMDSITKRLDVLECKLFDKEMENDQLKTKIESLEITNSELKDENDTIKNKIQHVINKSKLDINRLEQYSRRNNIRLDGVAVQNTETPEDTTTLVCSILNEKLKPIHLNLKPTDIDIAHRLGKIQNKKQQIIVKFQSRMMRNKILYNRRFMKGSKIYISEDLTTLNFNVLSCLRHKAPDEVNKAWSKDGRLYYTNAMDNKHEVRESDYDHWMELPWPSKG